MKVESLLKIHRDVTFLFLTSIYQCIVVCSMFVFSFILLVVVLSVFRLNDFCLPLWYLRIPYTSTPECGKKQEWQIYVSLPVHFGTTPDHSPLSLQVKYLSPSSKNPSEHVYETVDPIIFTLLSTTATAFSTFVGSGQVIAGKKRRELF